MSMMQVLATDGVDRVVGDPEAPSQLLILPSGGWWLLSLASVLGRPGWVESTGMLAVCSEAEAALVEEIARIRREEPFR